LRAAGVEAVDVQSIEVRTYATAITVAGIRSPTTPLERRFSIPFVVARALAEGRITDSSFDASTEAVDALMPRVAMTVDDHFDEQFPERRGARVIVATTSEKRREETVPDRPGSPENPHGPRGIDAKFGHAVAPVLNGRADDALRQLRGGASLVREVVVV
jgi:2-methylcitrate dehydratase PrpD